MEAVLLWWSNSLLFIKSLSSNPCCQLPWYISCHVDYECALHLSGHRLRQRSGAGTSKTVMSSRSVLPFRWIDTRCIIVPWLWVHISLLVRKLTLCSFRLGLLWVPLRICLDIFLMRFMNRKLSLSLWNREQTQSLLYPKKWHLTDSSAGVSGNVRGSSLWTWKLAWRSYVVCMWKHVIVITIVRFQVPLWTSGL